LNVEIGGAAAGTFDKLAVSGMATLFGTLNIRAGQWVCSDVGKYLPDFELQRSGWDI